MPNSTREGFPGGGSLACLYKPSKAGRSPGAAAPCTLAPSPRRGAPLQRGVWLQRCSPSPGVPGRLPAAVRNVCSRGRQHGPPAENGTPASRGTGTTAGNQSSRSRPRLSRRLSVELGTISSQKGVREGTGGKVKGKVGCFVLCRGTGPGRHPEHPRCCRAAFPRPDDGAASPPRCTPWAVQPVPRPWASLVLQLPKSPLPGRFTSRNPGSPSRFAHRQRPGKGFVQGTGVNPNAPSSGQRSLPPRRPQG